MIDLKNAKKIGSGETRNCYQHPNESDKCIKILKEHMVDDINHREYKYYRHLNKKRVTFRHIPKCYGFVKTTLGQGLVFDLIAGSNTVVFEDYLRRGDSEKNSAEELLSKLEQYLFENAISFIDTGLRNLVLSKNKLFIIDGLVPPKKTIFPIYGYISPLTRWRTRKSLKEARIRINRIFQEKNLPSP